MKAKKLPSGSWRCRAYVGIIDGKKVYRSFTADTKKEAEYLAHEWLTGRKIDKPEALTLTAAIDRYIESKSNTLSPSTIRGYRIAQRNAFSDIADADIYSLSDFDLQRWANGNAAKYSPKSIRNQFGLISAVLAQNHVDIDTKRILLKPKEKTEIEVPTPEIMSRIIALIRGKKAEIPVLIALMCGLRQSEIAALFWSDYDGLSLYVHAAVVPDEHGKLVRKEHAKSYAGNRRVDVPGYLRELLNTAPRDREHISPYRSPSGVLKALQAVCSSAGLPAYKMHALRHAYASLMLLEGIADKYAMERLGQSTPNLIKNVYQHTFRSHQDAITAKLDRKFDELAKPEKDDTKDDTNENERLYKAG